VSVRVVCEIGGIPRRCAAWRPARPLAPPAASATSWAKPVPPRCWCTAPRRGGGRAPRRVLGPVLGLGDDALGMIQIRVIR
jgi:hypothetical protein